MNDTIAAISTAFGEGAIALVRLSGPEAVSIAGRVFRGRTAPAAMEARKQHFGSVMDGERKLDDVLLSVHRAPASYTGEDVVEIACHGGVLLSRRILELLLSLGARSAGPGEFTQRAYLNGKMDLTQAEAVMDLISAQTDLALRAATEQLSGRLGERIGELRAGLVEVLAHVEAYIDFPDEDIDPATGKALLERIEQVETAAGALLATAGQGRILREGVRTVIYGAPNVGKSSLLNRLLGFERAIVSARPGTTRDVIEEVINLRGLPLRLVDTAGVRESEDEIEREGMERTRAEVGRADLVLELFEAVQAPPPGLEPAPGRLRILNKTDLGEHAGWAGVEAVRLSCLSGEGLERLADAIFERLTGGANVTRDWSVAINARHQAALQATLGFAQAARRVFSEGHSPEFIAEELRGALGALGDILGRIDHEEILGEIFKTFCIGK